MGSSGLLIGALHDVGTRRICKEAVEDRSGCGRRFDRQSDKGRVFAAAAAPSLTNNHMAPGAFEAERTQDVLTGALGECCHRRLGRGMNRGVCSAYSR